MKLSTILAASAAIGISAGAAGASSLTILDLEVIEDEQDKTAASSYNLADQDLTIGAVVSGNDVGNDGDYSGSFSVDLFSAPLGGTLDAGVTVNFLAFGDPGNNFSADVTWNSMTYDLLPTVLDSEGNPGAYGVQFLAPITSSAQPMVVSWNGASKGTQIDATLTAAPIPLPAAGWMLIAGLGGLAAVRRRKKAA